MCLRTKKKPYSEAESVIEPCLKIVANLLHGGKQVVDKVEYTVYCCPMIQYQVKVP